MRFLTEFLAERRRLHEEWERIELVQEEARILVEELRRRRDGCPPRYTNLPSLREALSQVHGTR